MKELALEKIVCYIKLRQQSKAAMSISGYITRHPARYLSTPPVEENILICSCNGANFIFFNQCTDFQLKRRSHEIEIDCKSYMWIEHTVTRI
jgi:hypothetical protein